MQITITSTESETRIKAPFNPINNAEFRARGGKFDGDTKEWVLRSEQAAPLIAELFGTSDEVVKVRVSQKIANGRDGFLYIGGYTLAARKGRDCRAEIVEPLVAGTIPSSGGSVKNPRVNASDDAVFELEVRRDFAEKHGLVEPPASAAKIKIAESPAVNPLASFSDAEIRAEFARRNLLPS